MADFPRAEKPNEISDLEFMRGEVTRAQSGPKQRRNTVARGVRWTEQWPPLVAGDPDVESLKRFIKVSARKEASFDVQHLLTPGSGKAPNGTGATGVTVDGSSQTGDTLDTAGWGASSTGVVVDGDVIKVAGIDHIFMITADANAGSSGKATLNIDPPILSGSSPADGASVTTSSVKIKAMVSEYSIPSAPPTEYLSGMSVTFEELP